MLAGPTLLQAMHLMLWLDLTGGRAVLKSRVPACEGPTRSEWLPREVGAQGVGGRPHKGCRRRGRAPEDAPFVRPEVRCLEARMDR